MTRPQGVGTDIVSVQRVRALLDDAGPGWERRWFTDDEVAYCRRMACPEQHFAARLAAKEAVVKALELAWDGLIPYREIEVVRVGGAAPRARLSGRVRQAADAAGFASVSISLAHTEDFATAVAVAVPFPAAHP